MREGFFVQVDAWSLEVSSIFFILVPWPYVDPDQAVPRDKLFLELLKPRPDFFINRADPV